METTIPIDAVRLHFDPASLQLLNWCLGLIMFGIALALRPSDFTVVVRQPKAVLVGMASQWLLLPVLTLGFILLTAPHPSLAMGMMLVAACPGGNISNYISQLAGANTALSISLSGISTVLCSLITPLVFAFGIGFYSPAAPLVEVFSLRFIDMLTTTATLILIPVVLGLTVRRAIPALAERLHRIMKVASLLFFAAFVVVAFWKNFDFFLEWIDDIFELVVGMNALALIGGWLLAHLSELDRTDRRTVTIETGIQNSGLGMILIVNFFDGLGGMMLVAAFWGVWHMVSGFALAFFWQLRDRTAIKKAPLPTGGNGAV